MTTGRAWRLAERGVSWVRRIPDQPWRVRHTLAFLGLCALALHVHVRMYGEFFIDDGMISLRYTDRLLHGQGLTWNDGERVEGYSNLLWVLLCAIPGIFGGSLVLGARRIGFLCALAGMAALLELAKPRRVRDGLAVLLPAWLLAATDSVAAWTSSGLESPLGIALLAWGSASTLRELDLPRRRYLLTAALCFGLLCWTRPDGPLWGAGAVFALGAGFVPRSRGLCLALGVSVAAFLGAQLGFRRLYYQEWVPNTAYAKLVLNQDHLKQGLDQLGESFYDLSALWLALALGLGCALSTPRKRLGAWLLALLAALWLVYQARAGGDIFPAWRHWGYFACIAAVAWVHGLRDRENPWAWLPAGVSLVVLAAVSAHFDPKNWAWTERWEWDGKPLARALRLAAGNERPLLAVDAAGTIPYYWRLPTLDMLGLTDRYLAHHPPKNMGVAAQMGHELGDADYFLARAPDLFCFGAPPCREGGVYPAQRELVGRPEFVRDYQLVMLSYASQGNVLKAPLYLKKLGKFGLRAGASKLELPPLLLARGGHAVSEVDSDERLIVRLERGQQLSVPELPLAAGRWRVRAGVLAGQGKITLIGARGDVLLDTDLAGALELGAPDAETVTLWLSAGQTDLKLSAIAFERVG